MTELWYRFVILAVGALNVVLDNWLIILLIVLIYAGARLACKGRQA